MVKIKKPKPEKDSVYFLKLLVFFALGAFWLRISHDQGGFISLPIGLVVGLILASHDHFAIDRNIEYAILIVATIFTAYVTIFGLWV